MVGWFAYNPCLVSQCIHGYVFFFVSPALYYPQLPATPPALLWVFCYFCFVFFSSFVFCYFVFCFFHSFNIVYDHMMMALYCRFELSTCWLPGFTWSAVEYLQPVYFKLSQCLVCLCTSLHYIFKTMRLKYGLNKLWNKWKIKNETKKRTNKKNPIKNACGSILWQLFTINCVALQFKHLNWKFTHVIGTKKKQ